MHRGAKSRSGPHTQMYKIHQERITAEMSPTPHPYWRSITHRPHEHLSNQNCGKEEKPHICEKDTIKTKKGQNDERKQQRMVNDWRSGIALRLVLPAYYPPGWGSCSANTTASWLTGRQRHLTSEEKAQHKKPSRLVCVAD